jgi:HD-GYP domain-containing protein (c-di-GMP phosphodiesterase class II)
MDVLPFDQTGMARLVARFEHGDWSRPCVKNAISGTPLGDEFPGLQNMVLIPIGEGSNRAGWIISCNLKHGREFGTVEASMLNSIAMILGTHARNLDLFKQNADLLLGFVRSLVSTIDAKDPYTRGHSERVARIARRIAEHLELPPDDLQDIYLAGLLHDVGKIGVDDRILRKPGALTPEEFAEVQKHPMIGFNILHELKNLQQILPGVRNHHECMNGRGYPDGLMGEEIPLMARILAVADSFDAMGSDRPYREGMPTEKIDEIFRKGAGSQWDARVIDAYFAVREDVERVCDEYRPGQEDALLAQTDAATAT